MKEMGSPHVNENKEIEETMKRDTEEQHWGDAKQRRQQHANLREEKTEKE